MSDFNEKNNVSIDPAAFAVAEQEAASHKNDIGVYTHIFKKPFTCLVGTEERPLSSWILTSTSSPARTVFLSKTSFRRWASL